LTWLLTMTFRAAVEPIPARARPAGTERPSWPARAGFRRPHRNTLKCAVQTFVLRAGGRTLLVDTCIGEHKDRPEILAWNQRSGSGFLDRLRRAGVDPASVDTVFCTHLHIDHVGWNTQRTNGRWAPTFPNARYLVGRTELADWLARRDAGTASRWAPSRVKAGAYLRSRSAAKRALSADAAASSAAFCGVLPWMYRCFHMRAGMMLGLTLCWRLRSAAARAFHVTKSAGAHAGFAAGDPRPLRLLGMGRSYTSLRPAPNRPTTTPPAIGPV
jgi:Metallo-beta-lactamase superfamily